MARHGRAPGPHARRAVAPALGDDVHVWRCLPEAARDLAGAGAYLSPGESERGRRLAAPHARRFVARRAFTRLVVSRYTGVSPADVVFDTTCRLCGDPHHGKPRVRGPGAVSFSVSGAGDIAVVAVARDDEIGVDVESVERRFDAAVVARRAFADDERAALDGMPSEHRPRALLWGWVQKEAVLKAQGSGLAGDTRTVVVEVGAPPPPPWPAARALRAGGFDVFLFAPGPGAVGAAAVRHLGAGTVRMLDLPRDASAP